MKDKLRLNRRNKIFLGVLSGISDYTGCNVIFLRLAFVVAITTCGLLIVGVFSLIYFIIYFVLKRYIDDKEETLIEENNNDLDIFDL